MFLEIERAYEGKQSIFDNFAPDDLILAFFPCTRFENQIYMAFQGTAYSIKNWSDAKKIDYALDLHNELSRFYGVFCKMFIICLNRNLRLIVENPYSQMHYLVRYFPIKAFLIDTDRTRRGDHFKKPTQYWFVNCKPENKMLCEATYSQKETKRITFTNNKVERSMISKEYANRFIKEFLV